ncbi:efflux RND transporter permease subunit [Opitutus sp. ER46]|uniref:efflux RND transporter permease subunit n=1 Tax=Opitutus sp. ER46 TaxID=2161864 RepID=UPI000D3117DB|nr:efflux RND transporter permease subunit [Opitutus sp. ER46]PTX97961.1 AcrB/AcrD/AcrF family protein [Opitutus sp. ER46]
MAHRPDPERLSQTHNAARFTVEHRHIAWVLLVATLLWGWYGYHAMPQRKDPDIPVRLAVAVTAWPGVSAAEVEQQITRVVEAKIAESSALHPAAPHAYGIRSVSLPGLSIVHVQLAENVRDTKKEFSDISLKLDSLNSRLPAGAGPIQFVSDFGDTSAMMLTIASPPVDAVEIALRARQVGAALAEVRTNAGNPTDHVAAVYSFPTSMPADAVRRGLERFVRRAERDGIFRQPRLFSAAGFVGVDGASTQTDDQIRAYINRYLEDEIQAGDIHPDAWGPAIIRDPAEIEARLQAVAGDKYSYRELDEFSDLIARSLAGVPQAAKYQRTGVLPERVYIDYAQERLAGLGLQPARLAELLQARNIATASGMIEAGGKWVYLSPTGEFASADDIGAVLVAAGADGNPVYLRDLAEISRAYQVPAQTLNYHTWKDTHGAWHRSRAVTVAVFMRAGEQIATFGAEVDQRLAALRHILPQDLMVVRTSDQPRQVRENIELFMGALYEAIALVVFVALIGFWEWRSALLMALSMPITLAMTFGLMSLLGIDLQQISIGSLIVALGLLVDNPVVAGDAIKRGLADGLPPTQASWRGPTKLAKAILFATITNVVAYLPFLLIKGATGEFLYSLPVVMACSLFASLIVAMTFVPLLGRLLLRAPRRPEPTVAERRQHGLYGRYARLAQWSIRHRWQVLAGSIPLLVLGAVMMANLRTLFFPDDVQYLSTIDVRLPNNASVRSTNVAVQEAERVIQEVCAREVAGKTGRGEATVLHSLTSFVGVGAPRFWFSISPEIQQPNYGQIIVQIEDKELMPTLAGKLQTALAAQVPGARVEVKQLQTNPVEFPVEIMISSLVDPGPERSAADLAMLRSLARRVENMLQAVPQAALVHTDWQPETIGLGLHIDAERANLAGLTHADIAVSVGAALNGRPLTELRERDRRIPVVARLRSDDRSRLSDLDNLYVYSVHGPQKLPLAQVASLATELETQRIQRRDRFRTITVVARPVPGALASQILKAVKPQLAQFQRELPPGYRLVVGGEQAKQVRGFKDLGTAMAISVGAIFLALVLQFNHAVKPLLVFAAVPFGVVGSIAALAVMGTPFGFMALMGIASLVGVIVSHVIVLFDCIEDKREEGEPLEQALVDAGIIRLRPVMITVAATVLALFPLALHGGPLWQPLCYAQIGGLTAATFVTLLLVPVLYSVCVYDLKLIRWRDADESES